MNAVRGRNIDPRRLRSDVIVPEVVMGRLEENRTLAVSHFEESGRQPLAGDLDPGQARLDSGHVLIGKAHLGRRC